MQELIEALAPSLLEAFMAIVGLATGYGVLWFRRWTGIQIEEQHRQRLHAAIRNFVVLVADRGFSKEEIIPMLRRYLRDGLPDAVKALNPSDSVLGTLIEMALRSEAK